MLKRKMHQQNLKTINLYLDKKLVIKLLNSIFLTSENLVLDIITAEILHYFCLDFIAFRSCPSSKIITFKSEGTTKFYKDREIDSLLENAENIDTETGWLLAKIEDKRQFIIFKHHKSIMLTIVEQDHRLSSSEKETLGHEIIAIIKLVMCTRISGENFS